MEKMEQDKPYSVNANSLTDFSSGQGIGMAVCLDNNGKIILQTNPNTSILGVLQNNPSTGEVGEVHTARGVLTDIMSGAAFDPGQKLMVDETGRFVPVSGTGIWISAYAIESSSDSGILVKSILIDGYIP